MLPVVVGVQRTARQILVYSGVMVLVSLMLVPAAGMGWVYLVAAIVLGAWFLIEAFRMSRHPERAYGPIPRLDHLPGCAIWSGLARRGGALAHRVVEAPPVSTPPAPTRASTDTAASPRWTATKPALLSLPMRRTASGTPRSPSKRRRQPPAMPRHVPDGGAVVHAPPRLPVPIRRAGTNRS